MSSRGKRNRSFLMRMAWLVIFTVSLTGVFSSYSAAEAIGGGRPPQCPPDSIVDTSGTSDCIPFENPTPDDGDAIVTDLDASLIFDLLMLNLAI